MVVLDHRLRLARHSLYYPLRFGRQILAKYERVKTMKTNRTTLAILLGSLVTVALTGTSQAVAGHNDFKFQGSRHGFRAETHMIHSLEVLERVANSNHPYRNRDRLAHASKDLRSAYELLRSSRAEWYLEFASSELRNFRRSGDLDCLDDASRLIQKAIAAEQRYRRQAREHRHHNHGSPSRYNNVRTRYPAVYPTQGGMNVGTRWGNIRIRF